MKQLTPNVFIYEDACLVYVIRCGTKAVLIDFGSGGILDELSAIGVEEVTDILMTHHHRDQGQGLVKAEMCGIRIWVPHAEQDLFRAVDEHWQSRALDNNYNTRQDRFSLLHSVAVAGTLQDYSLMKFHHLSFEIVPTPGHTPGSISILTEVDGMRLAFVGDLIAAPGKVWSLAATQWTYNGGEGLPYTIASLRELKGLGVDMLLPSHGEVMPDPKQAIDLVIERLWELLVLRKHNLRLFDLLEKPYEAVLPHLLKSRSSFAAYYVLLSESRKALLIDFGYDTMLGLPAGQDRASRRPWLYALKKLKRDYRVEKIDVVLPTHYHDDHVAGMNLLRNMEGTEVWAPANFKDVLENPKGYDLPCLWYDPIPVDRTLGLEEKIRWEEFELTLYALPGHTYYAAAVAVEIDGKRVLFAGDQYMGEKGTLPNYTYQNQFHYADFQKSAELFSRLAPDVVLTGHWEPVWTTPEYFQELKENGQALEKLHHQLLPLEQVDFGATGFGISLHPYQMEAHGSETMEVQAVIQNPFKQPARAQVKLSVPPGWTAVPPVADIELGAGETETVAFQIRYPPGTAARRERVAADLTIDGRRFGEQAEALVSLYE